MQYLGFAFTVFVAGMIGFGSKWGIDEWQYWTIMIPACVWVGGLGGYAFLGSR